MESESKVTEVRTDVLMGVERPSSRIAWVCVVFIALAILAMIFYKQTYVGLTDRDAVDIAQVARNIRDGNGFTTRFVRPFNAMLVRGEGASEAAELNHGPLYIYAAAVMFKARNPSDQVMIWTSLIFFFLTLVATYLLGWIAFNWRVGLLATVVVGISERVLTVGASGGMWPMAAALFTAVLCLVGLHHRAVVAQKPKASLAYTVPAAVTLALLYMTHQLFFFLIIPLAVYFGVTGQARRLHLIVFLAAAVLATAPWAVRNAVLTGMPVLGANAWDSMANTLAFPGDTFYRSTKPVDARPWSAIMFPLERFPSFTEKLTRGTVEFLDAMLPMLGFLALALAAVSLLYKFKYPCANAVRGFAYGAVPLMILVFALFSVDTKSVMVFAPLAAVFGSAYLLLLLKAKDLHPFYARSLVGGFLIITAVSYLTVTVWPAKDRPQPPEAATDMFFAKLAERTYSRLIYTDVPWTAAWRTYATAVWLPRTDDDVYELNIRGLPMVSVILTPESGKYSPEETWYMLHEVKLWRDYMRDPQTGLKKILEEARLTGAQAKGADVFLRRLKRSYPISESISGAVTYTVDPLAPDNIQVMEIQR